MNDEFLYFGILGRFDRPQINLMQEEYVQDRAVKNPDEIIFLVQVTEEAA